jgi:hypothetical protein
MNFGPAQNKCRSLVALALGILAMVGCCCTESGTAAEGNKTVHTLETGSQQVDLPSAKDSECKVGIRTRRGAFVDVDAVVEHMDWRRWANTIHGGRPSHWQFVLYILSVE